MVPPASTYHADGPHTRERLANVVASASAINTSETIKSMLSVSISFHRSPFYLPSISSYTISRNIHALLLFSSKMNAFFAMFLCLVLTFHLAVSAPKPGRREHAISFSTKSKASQEQMKATTGTFGCPHGKYFCLETDHGVPYPGCYDYDICTNQPPRPRFSCYCLEPIIS